MGLLDGFILGIVEGVTEFLPISSTGHLVLSAKLLGIDPTIFVKTFEVVIQLGAILAIVILFWPKLIQAKTWAKLLLSFIPTGLAGFFLYPVIKVLLGSSLVVVGALGLGGVFIIWFERRPKQNELLYDDLSLISWKQAIGVGFIQIISFIPGVSRAAASIFGGEILGLSRSTAVEYSFLLAVPTMVVASGYDLYKNFSLLTNANWQVLGVGFFVSMIVALIVVKWLLRFIKTETLEIFGWYRLIGAFFFFFFIV